MGNVWISVELWKGGFAAAAGRNCSVFTPATGWVQTLKEASLEAFFSSHSFPHPTSNKTINFLMIGFHHIPSSLSLHPHPCLEYNDHGSLF